MTIVVAVVLFAIGMWQLPLIDRELREAMDRDDD